ncbi:ROK family protein, putative glucokinase [Desulfosporosinus acidiphilus SJ4]|uniref:Glucokinase n=1 Tax=Desulfosporosinus acidiphilus (strain DSM 22704 / JCM 16185 / SJ4) TaxID=646529 RepID=I4D2Q0_DESAJ|nr:ROK family glucokinase [Desulfosporosinus acidiphilus]AFM40074.1 ROK family protein, putative glucokinase [Desulfosporosinus acidiphilus SJ4]
MKSVIMGIDLGGTSIKLGLVNISGQIVQSLEWPTPKNKSYHEVIAAFERMSEQLLRESSYSWRDILGVGIGIPGFLDFSTGSVFEVVNLGWHQVPLKEELERIWDVPVLLENDANAAALGEMWTGAGKGASHIICLTIGTGIGGGVIINGDIYHGANGSAGEIGHITVKEQGGRPCNCGKKGCLETEASATAIVLKTLEQVKGASGLLKEEYAKQGNSITAKSVVELAKLGDPTCQTIIADAGTVLGKALANMCYLLNPELIVIGGGISYAGEILFKPLTESFRNFALPRVRENTSIVQAKLGNQAGIVGAASLIHHYDLLES